MILSVTFRMKAGCPQRENEGGVSTCHPSTLLLQLIPPLGLADQPACAVLNLNIRKPILQQLSALQLSQGSRAGLDC
jgi:hypothetical protein